MEQQLPQEADDHGREHHRQEDDHLMDAVAGQGPSAARRRCRKAVPFSKTISAMKTIDVVPEGVVGPVGVRAVRTAPAGNSPGRRSRRLQAVEARRRRAGAPTPAARSRRYLMMIAAGASRKAIQSDRRVSGSREQAPVGCHAHLPWKGWYHLPMPWVRSAPTCSGVMRAGHQLGDVALDDLRTCRLLEAEIDDIDVRQRRRFSLATSASSGSLISTPLIGEMLPSSAENLLPNSCVPIQSTSLSAASLLGEAAFTA